MRSHKFRIFLAAVLLGLFSGNAQAVLTCDPIETNPFIPTVGVGGPYVVGTNFSFSQNCSSDLNTVTYQWFTGGNVISTSSSASFSPSASGSYSMGVTVLETGPCEAFAEPDPRACQGGGGTLFFLVSQRPVAVINSPGGVVKDVPAQLSGAASFDPDGEAVGNYQWSVLSRPSGSFAQPSPGANGLANFTCDKSGSYTLQLIASNELASLPVTTSLNCTNTAPNADISLTPEIAFLPLSDAVLITKGNSQDPDTSSSANLSYQWTLVSKPEGSTYIIDSPQLFGFTFFPDLAGNYVFQLVVNDGELNSEPAVKTLQVKTYNFTAPAINIRSGETGGSQISGEKPAGVTAIYSLNSQPAGGMAAVSESGAVSFIPHSDFFGTTSIPAHVALSNGLSFLVNIAVNVSSADCISLNSRNGRLGAKNFIKMDAAGQTCGEQPSQNPDGSPDNANCDTKEAMGCPVNLFSGAMWHRFEDFYLPGRTPATSLNFTRNYTASASGPVGDFGPNWRHNYETMLVAAPSGNGDINWIDENGGPWLFRKQGNNYLPAPGQSAVLKKFADRFELKKKDNTLYVFNLGGKLTTIRDLYNQSVELSYENNRLRTISAPMAGTLTIGRNASGRIISIHRSRDNLTHSYAYDGSGRLISSTDFANKSHTFTYNDSQPGTFAQGMMSSITDPLNRTITFTYYDNGRAAEQMEPMGGLRKFTYASGSFRQTEVEEIDMQHWVHSFNAGGRTQVIARPGGARISHQYDSRGFLARRLIEHGGPEKFINDARGNILSIQRGSDPVATLMEYDPVFNKPTLITPPLGAPTQFSLDPNTGDILQISRGNLSLQYSRDAFGNILSVNNGLTTYSYGRNSDGLLTSVFDLYNPQTLSYDSRNRLSQRAFASGQVIQYGYDDYDRVTSILDSHGPDIAMTFDTLGKMLSRSISDGSTTQTTTFAYDDQDRKISETDALGRTRQYIYDKEWFGRKIILKNPVAMIDEAGRRTEYKYDSMQRLIEIKDPRGAITKMTYDNRGNRIKVIDPAGKTTIFVYDLNDRLIQERRLAVTGNTVQEITKHLFRDQAGRLVKVTEGIKGGIFRASQYSYNNLDRIVQRLLLIESPTSTQVEDAATYSYSNQLDAELLTSANNNIAHLGFANNLAPPFKTTSFSLASAQSGNPLNLLEGNYSIARDVTGEISAISTNGNAIFSKSYDPAGRLTGVNAGGGFAANIGYDGFGRKSGISYADGTTAQMLYDSLNRATNINWSGASAMNAGVPISEALSYDLAGNIIQLTREHGSYTLGYDSVDQLVSSSSNGNNNFVPYNRAITYDFLGNRINDSLNGTGTFLSNFLLHDDVSSFVAEPNGTGEVVQETTGNQVKNFSYRADGRISGFQSGNLTVNYFYDGLNRMIAKAVNNNGTQFTQSFLFAGMGDRILQGRAGDGSVTTYFDGQSINQHLGELKNGVAKGYVTDHMGSVLNSEAAGSNHQYGIFGEVLTDIPISPSMNPVIFGFAGYRYDPFSKRYFIGPRTLNSEKGRWDQPEPYGLDGPNLYDYAHNSPQVYADHDGLSAARQTEGTGTSCAYKAQQVKESCQANVTKATLASECSLLGACGTTAAGFPVCSTVASGVVGTAAVLGTRDCNAQAEAAYAQCESQFSTPDTNPPTNASDILDFSSGAADIYEFLKLLKP